ncbi:unnamed protein product [Didymodactylos carnosus]|nr:unnamed protein product [Didymodactylos carnosus]CAF4058337.1 unnamed protein product [Didymodactylos carnosus]
MKAYTKNSTAVNSFLSTSRNRDVALTMARSNAERHDRTDVELVVFDIEMNINCINDSKMAPYADISNRSNFSEEVEVLFMPGSVFDLIDVKFDEQDRVWIVTLHLTCADSPVLTYIKQQLPPRTCLSHISAILYDMGQFDRAEQLLLELVNNSINSVELYDQLVAVKLAKSDYSSALEYIKKGLNHRMAMLSSSDLYKSYKLFGNVYKVMDNDEIAMDHYSIALGLLLSYKDKNLLAVGDVHLQIGLLHWKAGNLQSATRSFEDSLRFKQVALGKRDPEVARILMNLGVIANQQDKYERALEFLVKALDIQLEMLPSDHYDVAQTYNHIGLVYAQCDKQDLYLAFAHRSVTIELSLLPLAHPSRAELIETVEEIRSLESLWTMNASLHKVLFSERLATLLNR